jgi:cell migration-inducing and hyaluronan-binding protein
VCKGDVGRLNLSDSRGELPGKVDLESRTARFALLSSIGPNAPDTPLVQAQRAALFSRRAPQAPIALVRNGKEFKISGDQSTVKAGTEILVKTERQQVSLSLAEMDQGSWVMFELPGSPKQPPERNSPAWTHCARRTRRLISGAGMRSGSNWS